MLSTLTSPTVVPILPTTIAPITLPLLTTKALITLPLLTTVVSGRPVTAPATVSKTAIATSLSTTPSWATMI